MQVLEVDGHDRQAIREAIKEAEAAQNNRLSYAVVLSQKDLRTNWIFRLYGSPLGDEESS